MSEKKGCILVVDDEEMIRDILVEEFNSIAELVLEAGNGKEAIAILEQHPELDAVFSDISMPEMDGLELLEWVSSNRPHIGMVILSAYGDKKNTAKALKLGALDFLDKPFQITKLVPVAEEAISYGQLNRLVEKEVETLASESDIPPEKLNEWKQMKHKLLLLQYRKQKIK